MTRRDITIKAYNDGRIEADTFGHLAMEDFSDKVICKALEREWITKEFANELMEGEK